MMVVVIRNICAVVDGGGGFAEDRVYEVLCGTIVVDVLLKLFLFVAGSLITRHPL